jgi:hypothetical protein
MSSISATAASARKPFYHSLFVQVLVALLLGIVLGIVVPQFAVGLKFLSGAFLKLISMIVAFIAHQPESNESCGNANSGCSEDANWRYSFIQIEIGAAQRRCEQELGQSAFAHGLARPFLG